MSIMKRSAGSPTTITVNKTFQQLRGGYPLSPLFLFHYSPPFTLHSIFALDLVDGCFLFFRSNTPFTSLQSLTSTKIGQTFSRPTQLKEDTREHPHVVSAHQISSAVYYTQSLGAAFIMFKLSRERGTPFTGKLQE